MTEESSSAIGTVAQEAARLIEEMTTMARSSYRQRDGAGPHAGEPAQRPAWPDVAPATDPPDGFPAGGSAARAPQTPVDPPAPACSVCGAKSDDTSTEDTPTDNTPATCRLCPVCRGIALLRSVRPETVDLLADLAMSIAASLRDVAVKSRASEAASSARPTPGRPSSPDPTSVQDIHVDDESEG